MNHYELLFVLKPTLTDEENKSQIDAIINSVTAQDATIVAIDDMGMRRLAYPVEKNERGYYTVAYFQAPGVAIKEIERQLRINEEILKFMTLKYTNKKEVAQFTKMADAVNKKNTPEVAEETPVVEETPVAETPVVEAAPVEAEATSQEA